MRNEFYQSEVEFGFVGERDKVPIIQHWFHPFIARGIKEKHPDEGHRHKDPNYYVDYHGNYHILAEGRRPKHQVVTYGFKIDTRDPGTYELSIEITADGMLAKLSPRALTLVIEEVPTMKARCQVHHECFIEPLPRRSPR